MPAPLVSALGYLLAPRVIGAGADSAMQARMEALVPKLQELGMSPEEVQAGLRSDPYLNALANLPRQSGLESTIAALRDLYNGNPYGMPRSDVPPPGVDLSTSNARTIEELLAGRGFNDPSVQPQYYVERQGQFLTPMEAFLRLGGRDEDAERRMFEYQPHSYGQTDQPATEVRFDQPPGGAHGGIAALIRSQYAKR